MLVKQAQALAIRAGMNPWLNRFAQSADATFNFTNDAVTLALHSALHVRRDSLEMARARGNLARASEPANKPKVSSSQLQHMNDIGLRFSQQPRISNPSQQPTAEMSTAPLIDFEDAADTSSAHRPHVGDVACIGMIPPPSQSIVDLLSGFELGTNHPRLRSTGGAPVVCSTSSEGTGLSSNAEGVSNECDLLNIGSDFEDDGDRLTPTRGDSVPLLMRQDHLEEGGETGVPQEATQSSSTPQANPAVAPVYSLI
eukprot:gene2497-5450_t